MKFLPVLINLIALFVLDVACRSAACSAAEPDNWTSAARHGVDAILTDYPLSLARLLCERSGQ